MAISSIYPEVVGDVHLYEHDEDRYHPGQRWSVADKSGWLPGAYASREAALLAAGQGVNLEWMLALASDPDDPGRPVTFDELLAVGAQA